MNKIDKEILIVKFLYNEMKDFVSEQFDDSEKPLIQEAYKKYLYNSYIHKVAEFDIDFGFYKSRRTRREKAFLEECRRRYEESELYSLKEFKLRWEQGLWERKGKDFIKAMLYPDECFHEILCISHRAKEDAIKRGRRIVRRGAYLNDEKMYEEIIARLEALYENVEDFNKREAKQHYGDALLDLDFAYGKSNCCSLFASHYI
jgi:hypothetical protein